MQPSGSKLWELRFRHNGKENVLSFGKYPYMSLANAREKRTATKRQLARGNNPATQKKLDRITEDIEAKQTFEVVADEYIARILILTCVRPGEVRGAVRSEFNLEKTEWTIPAEPVKMRQPHKVPLSRQALKIHEDIWTFSDGAELVFPAIRSNKKPLSENAFNSAMRRMGYPKDQVTAHGFRSTASSLLNDREYNPDVIEAILAHQDGNSVRRTYNRATYWDQRVVLMQDWADILDGFRNASS